jgi:non-specific serine/threonine protein kinase
MQLSPDGFVSPRPTNDAQGWQKAVIARFSQDEPAGLIALAAASIPGKADLSFGYWRDFASEYLRLLCHVAEGPPLAVGSVEAPSPAQLAEWVLNAPPMPGAEYLTPASLAKLWQRLDNWTVAEVSQIGGIGEFLAAWAPQWSRVGRVTLHLAENKADARFPFAFMATYAAGLARDGRVRRLALGGALEEYAGARKKPELLRLLSPLHAAAKRSKLIADLVESGDVFHPLAWTPAEAHAFLKEILVYEECGLFAQLPNWWRKRARPQVSVTLDSAKQSALGMDAMLEFRMSLALGDQNLTAKETEAILKSAQGLMLLRGEWVEVDKDRLQQALDHWRHIQAEAGSDGVSFIEGMRLLAGASADLKAGDGIEEHASWSLVRAGDRLREKLAGLRAPGGLDGSPPPGLQGTLRDYQLAGVNWLWLCSQLGVGACLADDMGLGKTIQVLAALLRQKAQAPAKSSRPSLLVLPASLIGNWKDESARFAPDLRLLVAHRSELPQQQLADLAAGTAKQLRDIDLVITTYSMVARLPWLQSVAWRWVILDEAQAIKNPSAGQTKAAKKLRADTKVALTGTPVENRLGDLWSIFDFLNPGLLGTPARFKNFAKSLESRQHARFAPLRQLVAPYILRRMKTDPDIVSGLPDKTEMRAFCGLAKPQAALYQQAVDSLARGLDETSGEGSGIKRRGLVLSYLMRFKQICNHPSQLTGDGRYDATASGKFARLTELCTEIASRGEKALIFTQFREITEPLSALLADVFGRTGLVLHGGTAVKKRKSLVADFQRDGGPPFFVLSIKAGGTGLNLTAASHVIHFDRWWNPAVENQATDRAFRIGQQRNVLVHKFVTRGTIEEKIDALIREKQDMADALLGDAAEKSLTEMSDSEILDLVSLDIERASM